MKVIKAGGRRRTARPHLRSSATRPITKEAGPPLRVTAGGVSIELADALDACERWDPPTVIVCDGPYGVEGFPGDPPTVEGLADWYAPHVASWSRLALPETTLWFWGTEQGWAAVHATILVNGWEFRACHTWDKGIAHVAGNVNGRTIRRFPVVTEVCVQYVRKVLLPTETGELFSMKAWLRHEWKRAGLPLALTNEACGVLNAATRKYFTQCHRWYFPPPEHMVQLAAYAKKHGKPTDRPYFSPDGETPLTAEAWARMRAKWNHAHGVTNVWSEPAVRGSERLKDKDRSLHTNQKPLKLVERIIAASSDEGDVVWEPFGGLCSAAIVSFRLNRRCFAAEILPDFFQLARDRLGVEANTLFGPGLKTDR